MIMRRNLLIFATFFIALTGKAQVTNNTVVETVYRTPGATQLADVRYEYMQAPSNSAQAFLLDKYEGRVWHHSKKKGFSEVVRENPDAVEKDKVNYQLYISASNSSLCYLLNVHTGEMWKLVSGQGRKSFVKMKMPWDNK